MQSSNDFRIFLAWVSAVFVNRELFTRMIRFLITAKEYYMYFKKELFQLRPQQCKITYMYIQISDFDNLARHTATLELI